MKCTICEERKPRRYCPGVRGEICTMCCGEERENTILCPFDCVYLQEARGREKPEFPKAIPYRDIRIPDRFLDDHPNVFSIAVSALVEGVRSTPQAIDYDVREALDALLRTFKTLQSGLVYETRPSNLVAAGIYEVMQRKIEEIRGEISKTGRSIRDVEVFTALLLLQRLEYRRNNGRKMGRAFIGGVVEPLAEEEAADRASPALII